MTKVARSPTFIRPSQREQTITSTAKTRFNSAAQPRCYAECGGDGFGDGAVDDVDTDGAGAGRAGG
jgi:hypothetical protein